MSKIILHFYIAKKFSFGLFTDFKNISKASQHRDVNYSFCQSINQLHNQPFVIVGLSSLSSLRVCCWSIKCLLWLTWIYCIYTVYKNKYISKIYFHNKYICQAEERLKEAWGLDERRRAAGSAVLHYTYIGKDQEGITAEVNLQEERRSQVENSRYRTSVIDRNNLFFPSIFGRTDEGRRRLRLLHQ